MRDAFTENLCKLYRQDLAGMRAGTYVSPQRSKAMILTWDNPLRPNFAEVSSINRKNAMARWAKHRSENLSANG